MAANVFVLFTAGACKVLHLDFFLIEATRTLGPLFREILLRDAFGNPVILCYIFCLGATFPIALPAPPFACHVGSFLGELLC